MRWLLPGLRWRLLAVRLLLAGLRRWLLPIRGLLVTVRWRLLAMWRLLAGLRRSLVRIGILWRIGVGHCSAFHHGDGAQGLEDMLVPLFAHLTTQCIRLINRWQLPQGRQKR